MTEPTIDEQAIQQQEEFVEVGLSLLAQQKLDELTTIQSRVNDLRLQEKELIAVSVLAEESRTELAETEMIIRKERVALDQDIAAMEVIHEANKVKEAELRAYEKTLTSAKDALETREREIESKSETLIKDARWVSSLKKKNDEREGLLERREERFEERKAKLMEVEKARQTQAVSS